MKPADRATGPGGGRRRPGGRKKGDVCPLCGKPQTRDYRPFCSKHCADIDLGRWLAGHYTIHGEPLNAAGSTREDSSEQD